MFVYEPKFLRVNLSTGDIKQEVIPEKTVRDFVGGRGIGAKYLYDELHPGIEPLSPDNKLLLVTGHLAGTSAQATSRWMAVTKGPATGTFTRSVGGGDFGAWLRWAGFDFILLEGKAKKPVYLYIEGDRPEIREAGPLWGMDTQKVQDKLKEMHGANTRAACIGPAGEKLVRFAAIFSDRRCAGRGGTGAVMGSKNLKAVAIRAARKENLANPEEFRKLVQEQVEAFKGGFHFNEFRQAGTTGNVAGMNIIGIYPVRNFRDGELKGWQAIGPEEYAKITEKHIGCYSCMIQCGKIRKAPSGPYVGISNEGPEYESIWAFSGTIDCADIGATLAADYLCDNLGLDTISAGCVIGFAYELFERGILTVKDTDGLQLNWGNHASMIKLIEKMGHREGLGDILAEGALRAARRIGKGAEAYAMHVKGLELPAYEPRGAKGLGLNFATANVGGNHNYGYSMQELYGVPIPRAVDRLADEGKGDITKINQDFTAFWELSNICVFPALLGWFTPQLFGKMLVAATGVPEFGDLAYLNTAAERVYNLEHLFNIREGFSRKDDTLPRRMLAEPLGKGASQGAVIKKLDTLLDEYYQARGWNREGVPTAEKLKQLGLEGLATRR